MDKIDVVFYINLAHRTDRRASIEEQCKKVGIPAEKIVRIDAIKRTPGMLGCIMSHIKTLSAFLENKGQTTALVLEDDFIFKAESPSEFDASLNLLFSNFPKWDVVNFAYNIERLSYLDTSVPSIKKALSVLTTSGYLVTRPMAEKILENWRIVQRLNEELGTHGHTSLDVSWTSLQPQSDWYIFWPAIGSQCDGYSDIINQTTAFGW